MIAAVDRLAPMKVVGAVQARMGSTRLPGKVVLPLAGKPMVVQIAARLGLARSLSGVVVSAPFGPRGQVPLYDAVLDAGIELVPGPEEDLILRHLAVAEKADADAVCRITGDCPLVDAGIVDLVVTTWRERGGDYCSNIFPRHWPDGLDVEVISRSALEALNRMTRAKSWLCAFDAREELTRTFWERPGLFRVHGVVREPDGLDRLQWSVNTPEEYRGAQAVYDTLEPGFSWQQVLQAFGPKSLSEISPCRTGS